MSSEKDIASMEGTLKETDTNQLLSNKWYVPEEAMKETPSVVRGMSVNTEMEYRRRGIRFIKYMMRYLTFEKIIQGSTLDQTKTPRVFPTAVHIFHRFYTIHPFQIFNEYVTAVACVFHAAKIEEHILPINRILELARINATSLPWVKIPDELSFDKAGWLALWKNEVSETEFLVFTTVNPMRFLFVNVYGFILLYLRKWVTVAVSEEEAVRIRDRAFVIASDVYSCGCPLIVTEPTRMVATMCLMMVLKQFNITITDWKGKTEGQLYWYHAGDTSTTLEKLKKMEKDFLAQLKQYNLVKTMDDKNKTKGVSPSSDYGSEGSVTSNPVSPSDSMCSDRDALSNEPTSPAISTASSSDHGLAFEGKEHMKRPVTIKKINLAPPCQLSLSVRKDLPSSSATSSSLSSFGYRQGRKLDMPMITPIEPVQKKMKIHSPVRYP